jgi:glycosyltransferase involved in cell wall biosynthesis
LLKVSIVTISFNQVNYLGRTIQSVLNQDYPNIEYIVVDPGSTDGSRELIKSYESRIARIIFEKDTGPAEGLNKGFAVATGEIFGFLNSDDILYPGAVSRVAQLFEAHPDCDIAMGDGYKIDGRGHRIGHYKARDFSVRRYFYGGARWLQQSTFFRADIYRKSPGFNLENRTCWDGEFFVNLAKDGARIRYIRADLAAFRIHEASISGSGRTNQQYQKDSRRIFRQVLGHEWGVTDKALAFAYRAEGFLKNRLHLLSWKGTE